MSNSTINNNNQALAFIAELNNLMTQPDTISFDNQKIKTGLSLGLSRPEPIELTCERIDEHVEHNVARIVNHAVAREGSLEDALQQTRVTPEVFNAMLLPTITRIFNEVVHVEHIVEQEAKGSSTLGKLVNGKTQYISDFKIQHSYLLQWQETQESFATTYFDQLQLPSELYGQTLGVLNSIYNSVFKGFMVNKKVTGQLKDNCLFIYGSTYEPTAMVTNAELRKQIDAKPPVRYFPKDESYLLNTFKKPTWNPEHISPSNSPKVAMFVGLFQRLLTSLYPDSDVCSFMLNGKPQSDIKMSEFVMQYMAWVLQNIGKRSNKCLILTSPEQGIGKSTLGNLMIDLLGVSNCSNIGDKMKNTSFHDAYYRKCFVMIDDCGATDAETYDFLKGIITSETYQYNIKCKGQQNEQNFLNLMITSNHINPIPLDSNDRRFVYASIKPNADLKVIRTLYSSKFNEMRLNDDTEMKHLLMSGMLNYLLTLPTWIDFSKVTGEVVTEGRQDAITETQDDTGITQLCDFFSGSNKIIFTGSQIDAYATTLRLPKKMVTSFLKGTHEKVQCRIEDIHYNDKVKPASKVWWYVLKEHFVDFNLLNPAGKAEWIGKKWSKSSDLSKTVKTQDTASNDDMITPNDLAIGGYDF